MCSSDLVHRPPLVGRQQGVLALADLAAPGPGAFEHVDTHEPGDGPLDALGHVALGLDVKDELALVAVGRGHQPGAEELPAVAARPGLVDAVGEQHAELEKGVALGLVDETHPHLAHDEGLAQVDVDEPIVDTAVLPTFLLVEEARKSVKVALSGEGADELFAGYHRYQRYLKAKKISSLLPSEVWQELIKVIPGRWKEKFIRATTPLSKSYSSQNIWSAAELGQLVVGSSYQPQKKQPSAELFRNNPLLAMQLTDYHHWLPEQLLMKIDKISMTQNLEARSPFLDTELINFAFSLPNKHKHMFGQNKYLLRKVAACYLPKEIAWKNKHGFEVPLNDWFRKELRDVVEDMVDELGKLNKIFDKNYLNQIKDEHFSGKQQHRDKIWSLVVLSKWLEKHRAEIEI